MRLFFLYEEFLAVGKFCGNIGFRQKKYGRTSRCVHIFYVLLFDMLVASGIWVEPFGDVETTCFVVAYCGVVVDVVHVVAPNG